MRRFAFAALVLLALPAASYAQDIDPAAEDKPSSSVTSSATTGPEIVAPARTIETNMRVAKGSGGKPTSYLVTSAPMPDDYVMGKSTAKLILLEYASLTCPHCAHFSNAVLPELEKKYIETGKMRYILRQFPLNEPALKGAMLLDCVGEQNKQKYFVFSKVLFEAQNKWAFDANYMAGLETIAQVGGLSHEQFQHCVNNTDREMKVLKTKKLATDDLKVPHTPYILIGGEVYEGDRSVEEMSKFIDEKLAQFPPN